MIISHKYKFIFIKTYKTAGTSLEVFLSGVCGQSDVFTPVNPYVSPHEPRNYAGLWSPWGEFVDPSISVEEVFKDLVRRRKYYNHIPANKLIYRVSSEVWNSYYKFCIERNPWDKVVSQYNMFKSDYANFDDYLAKGVSCFNSPFYTGRNGELLIDEVVKYENLGDGLLKIFKKLDVPFNGELDTRAKSNHRPDNIHYRKYYSESQQLQVQKLFYDEIKLHGYKF